MSGEDAYRLYSQHLTTFEREEVKQYETVYYLNISGKKKAIRMLTDTEES
jgi:hypothetical protein